MTGNGVPKPQECLRGIQYRLCPGVHGNSTERGWEYNSVVEHLPRNAA